MFGILCTHTIRMLLKNNYFCLPTKYFSFRWRRKSSLISKSSHLINCNDKSYVEILSLVQCLEVECLKKEDRVKVATKEVERVIELVKGMAEVQEHSIELEHDVSNNNEYDVENPMISKAKGWPRGSRPEERVEVAKTSRHCHFPNCGGTNHDSWNCPNKKKKVEVLDSQYPNK